MRNVVWLNWAICAITSLFAPISNSTVFSIIPDESVKEQRAVADDASSAGLFVLTALQGQPVIHVTFRM